MIDSQGGEGSLHLSDTEVIALNKTIEVHSDASTDSSSSSGGSLGLGAIAFGLLMGLRRRYA